MSPSYWNTAFCLFIEQVLDKSLLHARHSARPQGYKGEQESQGAWHHKDYLSFLAGKTVFWSANNCGLRGAQMLWKHLAGAQT